ncbi:MAG: hypothetical protein DMG30_15315 [Acidobacteria bacterium]|nr:MAG: hypothetical protein DMG30_15315 [Acidobacteriota bacterium]
MICAPPSITRPCLAIISKLELEDGALADFRRVYALGFTSAFVEGWGLYAERLAAESGWCGDDLEGLLGELDSELFRARRLVVDTHTHTTHWRIVGPCGLEPQHATWQCLCQQRGWQIPGYIPPSPTARIPLPEYPNWVLVASIVVCPGPPMVSCTSSGRR